MEKCAKKHRIFPRIVRLMYSPKSHLYPKKQGKVVDSSNREAKDKRVRLFTYLKPFNNRLLVLEAGFHDEKLVYFEDYLTVVPSDRANDA